jgi:metal-responsive CopG/Arc/MetJ family transcriptional regulator
MPKKPKQKLNMIRVSVYLTKEQKAQLDSIYEKTGAKSAEIIRRALDAYLKEHK